MDNIPAVLSDNIPVLSEFMRYGMAGICIALIIGMCYQPRLFINALLTMMKEVNLLNNTIANLSAKVDMITFFRKIQSAKIDE